MNVRCLEVRMHIVTEGAAAKKTRRLYYPLKIVLHVNFAVVAVVRYCTKPLHAVRLQPKQPSIASSLTGAEWSSAFTLHLHMLY
jgi:hypothetical protein